MCWGRAPRSAGATPGSRPCGSPRGRAGRRAGAPTRASRWRRRSSRCRSGSACRRGTPGRACAGRTCPGTCARSRARRRPDAGSAAASEQRRARARPGPPRSGACRASVDGPSMDEGYTRWRRLSTVRGRRETPDLVRPITIDNRDCLCLQSVYNARNRRPAVDSGFSDAATDLAGPRGDRGRRRTPTPGPKAGAGPQGPAPAS